MAHGASITSAASARIPDGARRIDGRGKSSDSRTADAQTHLYSDNEVADSLASYELGVILANGVTARGL